MRYRGQSHELSVPEGADRVARFHAEHRRRFGFAEPGAPVEVVTVEVRAALPADSLPTLERSGRRSGARPLAHAPVTHHGARLRAVVWTRAALDPGTRLKGPAIVADEGATLWLPPRWSARVHSTGAIVAIRSGSR
jgi:N-methylhydantoinase A